MKLYLDLCCLNRPFDDQSQGRIALESQAVALILEKADRGEHTLCSSAALVVDKAARRNAAKIAVVTDAIRLVSERAF